MPFCEWLRGFWDFNSPYIAERLAHGQRATRRRCNDMHGRVNAIEKAIEIKLALGDIRRHHLVDLGLKLRESGLAPSSVNKTMTATTAALRWAAANEIIPADPTKGLRGFAGEPRRRGILEPAEVKALFASMNRPGFAGDQNQ
jgi:site-specific recombinase XerD